MGNPVCRAIVTALVVLTAMSGCVEMPPRPPLATPAPAVTPLPASPVSAQDISGYWLYAQDPATVPYSPAGSEAPAGPVAFCANGSQPYTHRLQLMQTGDAVTATVDYVHRGGGILDYVREQTTGTFKNGILTLSGTVQDTGGYGLIRSDTPAMPVTYALRYNPATQHLVGTRNGQPFWTTPFVVQPDRLMRPSACGPMVP